MIGYKDLNLYKELLKHPGLKLNEKHPAVKLERYAKDGKSFFKLTEKEAIQMQDYYKTHWDVEVVDDFGDSVYDFKEIFAKSYCEDNDDLTIKELHDAHEVEKELLKESVEGD